MAIYIYNTLSGKKEPLIFVRGKPLRLFVCGPTVYDDSHIGHARTYLVFDAFVKYLRSQRKRVFYLQNITDIDDKIIARAQEEGTTPKAIARKFTLSYFRDMKSLNVTAVDIYAPATEYIPEVTEQVQTLLKKGYAYEIAGDGIYFDVSKFEEYGKLSRRTIEQAEDAISRVDESVSKRNKGDFALWKFTRDSGEPGWLSDLGLGRPGWHIEDTAIAFKHFGPQYDLHGGAVDLKFPHHEAEIAQAEALSGRKPFVKIWMHTGFLTVHGRKMAKSLKNYITIAEYLKKYPAQALRLLVLLNHYRTPVNYTEKLAIDSEKSWGSILEFMAKLDMLRRHRKLTGRSQRRDAAHFVDAFHKALEDDFNTPKALAAIFDFMASLQPKIWELNPKSAEAVYGALKSALKSLGFELLFPKIPAKIAVLAKAREQYRKNKQFTHSDELRLKINALGYVVEDTPVGPFLWPSKS